MRATTTVSVAVLLCAASVAAIGAMARVVVATADPSEPVRCVAAPGATASALYGALDWVCGVEGCGAVRANGTNYYPNTIIAHATFAFSEYFRAHVSQGPAACNFGGAGILVDCDQPATATCNASSTASDADLQLALDWTCSANGIQDCGPIMPGGAHFYPNTTRAHANWAFTVYFRAYRCVPGWDACDFNGTARLIR